MEIMETKNNVEANQRKPEERIIPIAIEDNSSNNTPNIYTSLTTLNINEPVAEKSENISFIDSTEPNCGIQVKPKDIKHDKQFVVPCRNIPSQNVPEMIIICCDTCVDKFSQSNSTASMLQKAIEIFVLNKNFIDPRHEFALLTLNKSSVRWVQEFTCNPCEIILSLRYITENDQDDEFDLSLILEEIWKSVTVPKADKDMVVVPPPYVVRLILLYTRSHCTPVVKNDFKELLNNPYFTIDVIMMHEQTSIDNRFQEIFKNLQQLDEKGYSYSFKIGQDSTSLQNCMAKLLSHPLQRPIQSLADYNIPLLEKEDV